ncbi:MAG: purine-nucleoside phosphorylase [bacterium]|jgi:purine-nucleoside phosphorylase|nr:purine-nucleoside phosphorylase [Planctomycetota bacterium]HIL50828.1 purine-nucleoside phosphorylase [Planctomycetota bacterium]
MNTTQQHDEATECLTEKLRALGVAEARAAFVLGSGLGPFADRLQNATRIPYAELAGMPTSGVPGHEGQLVLGEIEGRLLVVQQGRVHFYEGWSARQVTRCVRSFANLGIDLLMLTNAAGGMDPSWELPTLMRITDHINLQGRPPLNRGEASQACPYDSELGELMDRSAQKVGVELQRGIYMGLFGPTYETPAEVRMASWAGASAVGMSTVAEATVARSAGMRVAAVSAITNPAAGISKTPLNHAEVVEAGRALASRFCILLEAFVETAVEPNP